MLRPIGRRLYCGNSGTDSPKSNCIVCLHYRVGCVSPISSLEAVEVSTGEVGRMLGGEEDSVLLHSLVYLGGGREGGKEGGS